ncbi:D-alanyl-D-alanine carboxypeptidase/D-alanyl-D-alanine-endopeptidase [Streptomyces cavernae]|uniref:D-alanyl-D-alanine carboxypeptidase/D-alanyl-D-alanine endopeptidase n=1 Tax=Streptomyces cavernae TaxID=2259034 RepID=UPI000FEBA47D|nr:D-alanyl-D-alanine carboxypeptidase/D-alanyl-D-alanine-endopeptidase [Streptomyces cavernae]
MVVPELKPWRGARPHVARVVRALRPHRERLTARVKPHGQRLAAAVKPHGVRLAEAVRPRGARVVELVRETKPNTWQLTAGAATLGLVLSAGAVTAAGPWDSTGQRTAERDRAAALETAGGADHGPTSGTSGSASGVVKPAPSAPAVLSGLGGAVPSPAERALARVLDPLLDAPAPGGANTAAVADVATGKLLYGKDAGRMLTPASTTKIATAVAALSAAGADHRITTRTVLEPSADKVVLVGGGDPTLTAREKTAGNASLRTLADATARALKARGKDAVTLSYDTSLYSGPTEHAIGVNDNLAPVVPLMADEGRLDDSTRGPAPRGPDPAADAARTFADLLAERGIKAKAPGRPKAPGRAKASPRATELASVQSPPLSALVERMLTNSDNDIAEALARQTALASGEPASFDGAAAAVGSRLAELGLPLKGARFADGSGLDRADRLSAGLLTALLALAGDTAHPELRSVLTGLPVAGFTGTLSHRYSDESPATGLVRAKTGTLTGVNTLAGTVVDTDGRLLAFAFLASRTTDPQAAQQTLDRAATALAGCGCR